MLIQEAAAPISKKGFLYKTGSDRAGWKRRYCTLDRFRGFQYYKTETVSAPVQPSHCWREGGGGWGGEREVLLSLDVVLVNLWLCEVFAPLLRQLRRLVAWYVAIKR